jgi:hypothetical protein
MDLSKVDTTAAADSGADMQVRNPATGEPLVHDDGAPVTITLCGVDSQRYKKAEQSATDRRLQAQQPGRRAPLTAAGLESDRIELIVACTLGWNIERPECNAVNARKAYRRLPWLFEQADQFVGDRSNFRKAS